ncbi:MAG: DNA topology modulation protein [Defluviitaleaceae bacterium]|nr:DNA topology modulation protein [Defluviitaleaceae bacterium]
MHKLGKRIMIIGSGGSGKSTLARQLGERLDLPVIHLDAEFWNAGWMVTPQDEWVEKQKMVLSGAEWIADGNYSGSMGLRLERADSVILLDFNRFTCLWGVTKRRIKNRGTTRPDMAEGCPEQLDFTFLKWIWRFPARERPKIIEKLSIHTDINQIILRNRKEVRQFLAGGIE